jgi:RHH-type transcriptional regulator, proline utilization regulon repressor / proline dehydrogenase / delta 1-pyrroline-5-carboxylate dehydrogenase
MELATKHPAPPARGDSDAEIERLTRAYCSEIFARLDRSNPILFSPSWWDDRLMELTMGDQAVKLQLFRFIDALPLLTSPPDVSRHLREYFEEAGPALPGWVQRAVRWLPRKGWAGGLLAKLARANARRLARRFIAGSNLPEALDAVAAMRRRSRAFTLDLLGEATITESEAVHYQEAYLELIEGLSGEVNAWPANDRIDCDDRGPIPRVNVSLKLSSLYSQFDPIDRAGTTAAVRARLLPIFRSARQHRAFVNVDMEQYASKDITLHIFRQILDEPEFRDWPDVGIAIQAYLRDTPRDLEELARWAEARGTPVQVRLIKGAYWDYETVVAAQQGWPVPVFTQKWETDATYEQLSRFLLENRHALRPAFGSHNVRSLAHALATAQVMGLPPGSYEIQMLYGMADPVKDALVSLGQRVRVYTPYGELLPGMAYLVRRLLENTANESFLRASFTERVPEEQLLMNPASRRMKDEGGRMKEENKDGSGSDSSFILHPSSFRNEPHSDFSRDDVQQAMRAALEEVKGRLGRTYPLVIGGREVSTAETIDSLNPSHRREVVGRCGKATVEDAQNAVLAAHAAFPKWRDTDAEERAGYLFRAAEVMRRRRFELSAWEVYECGKQWREADADVAEAIDFCEYYARQMLALALPRRVDLPGEENAFLYEPRGVTVVIAPWNFPLAILCGMVSAALVAGNPVVMKPAEQSAVVGAKLMEVYREAGLPAGVLNYLPGVGEEIGPTLIIQVHVAMIAFTGSRGVGLTINRMAAANMAPAQDHVKRVLAEMGGKNAIIVDDDADLDEAVTGVALSAFGYQGQKCSACSRAIVLQPLYDTFLQRLVEATRSLKVAPAEEPGSVVGPLIDADAQKRVLGYIEKGKQEARLAYAGEVGALADEGYYVAPHIFADVPPAATIAQEEIFGPVLAVLKARDLDEALAIANGTMYALTGGVYSRSPANIKRVKSEFRVGDLYINRKITGALVGRQPFGGFKLSGIGSQAGGPDYLLQFLIPRTITENTMRRGFAPTREAGPLGVADAPAGGP